MGGREPLNARFEKALGDDYSHSLAVNPTRCGLKFTDEDDKTWLSVYVATTVARYAPTRVVWKAVVGQEWQNALPATGAFSSIIGVFPVARTAKEGIRWLQVGGWCKGNCNGAEDIAAGDYVAVLNGGAVFIADATGTTVANDNQGVCKTAHAADATLALDVYLIDKPVEIAAT